MFSASRSNLVGLAGSKFQVSAPELLNSAGLAYFNDTTPTIVLRRPLSSRNTNPIKLNYYYTIHNTRLLVAILGIQRASGVWGNIHPRRKDLSLPLISRSLVEFVILKKRSRNLSIYMSNTTESVVATVLSTPYLFNTCIYRT